MLAFEPAKLRFVCGTEQIANVHKGVESGPWSQPNDSGARPASGQVSPSRKWSQAAKGKATLMPTIAHTSRKARPQQHYRPIADGGQAPEQNCNQLFHFAPSKAQGLDQAPRHANVCNESQAEIGFNTYAPANNAASARLLQPEQPRTKGRQLALSDTKPRSANRQPSRPTSKSGALSELLLDQSMTSLFCRQRASPIGHDQLRHSRSGKDD